MKIGILTGGGDCPCLNAVIRAVVRKSLQNGHEMVGVRNGWRGIWIKISPDLIWKLFLEFYTAEEQFWNIENKCL
jgi:6-phosphofructokinase